MNDFAGLRAGHYAAAAAVATVLGSLALMPLWMNAFHLWATDPLRSIGAAFPVISFIGVLAAWRRLKWVPDGRSWALLLILISIPLARIVSVSFLDILYHGKRVGLMHPGPVLFLYGIGATLLFGGPRLLRAAIAPLCLLLFIDPVPRIYNSLVDLPLQQISAETARAFAHLIGLHPTGEQLRMMFAPDFGMMIVPGCNGVRGSITLAYLALIFGYSRRLRPRSLALVALMGFLSGYILNLLRLCLLVVYYRIGISVPSIQDYGVGVDYGIGCTLFLLATLAFGLFIRSLEPPPTPQDASEDSRFFPRPELYRLTMIRAACLFVLASVFVVPELRSAAAGPTIRPSEDVVVASFPPDVGPYRLLRTYTEHDTNGMIVLALADYEAPPSAGHPVSRITFGLWVGSGNHLVSASKLRQGLHPQATGAFDASASSVQSVHFAFSFYDDGISREDDAETACTPDGCSDHLAGSASSGLLFVGPRARDLAFAPVSQRLPILLRREWADSDPTPSPQLRADFENDARAFTRQLDLKPLVQKLGSRTD